MCVCFVVVDVPPSSADWNWHVVVELEADWTLEHANSYRHVAFVRPDPSLTPEEAQFIAPLVQDGVGHVGRISDSTISVLVDCLALVSAPCGALRDTAEGLGLMSEVYEPYKTYPSLSNLDQRSLQALYGNGWGLVRGSDDDDVESCPIGAEGAASGVVGGGCSGGSTAALAVGMADSDVAAFGILGADDAVQPEGVRYAGLGTDAPGGGIVAGVDDYVAGDVAAADHAGVGGPSDVPIVAPRQTANPALEKRAPMALGDVHRCAACGDPATKRCTGCGVIWYCNQVCQRRHWKRTHRVECPWDRCGGGGPTVAQRKAAVTPVGSVTHRCSYCGTEAQVLSKCSDCKLARYCNASCHLKHWRLGHKAECFKADASGTSCAGDGRGNVGVCSGAYADGIHDDPAPSDVDQDSDGDGCHGPSGQACVPDVIGAA